MTDHDPRDSDPLWDEGLRAAFADGDEDDGASGPPSVLARIEARIGHTSRVFLRDGDDGGDAPILDVHTDQKLESTQRYQVLGEIARGGIGVVLQGRDTNLGRDVALKVLRDRHRGNGELLQRFVEEAQIGGQLQHPGIVPVYDLGLDGERRPFFTMKLVKGRTLAALLAERKDPSDRGRFLGIYATICQTIAYAHSRGVIHRDLKPANVMVGAFGEVQVMDWGFAKVLAKGGVADETLRRPSQAGDSVATVRSGPDGSASFAGSIYGTPAYMPPEQAQGGVDRLDERADVFALGSILCEILTGDPPYRSAGDRAVIEDAAAARLDDARARLDASGADPELIRLARQCLEPDPADRPRNAASVAQEIDAYLATVERRATEARVEAAAAQVRVVEERKSRRLTVALATTVVASITLVALGGWWIERRAADRRERLEDRVRSALLDGQTAAGRGDWVSATVAVERASELAASGEIGDAIRNEVDALRTRATASVERLDRRDRLDDLRLLDDNDPAAVEREFARVLRDIGVQPGSPMPALDDAIRSFARSTRTALGSVLDDWALRRYDRRHHSEELGAEAGDDATPETSVEWIVAAAKRVDPDPWRGALRDAALTADLEALRRLADSSETERLPASSVDLLALSLSAAGQPREGIAVLVDAFDRYPNSFWVNLHLSRFYREVRESEAAERHAMIARSLRPGSSAAWMELALWEVEFGDTVQAETYLAKAEALSAEDVKQREKLTAQLARKRTERDNRLIDDSARRLRMRLERAMRGWSGRGPERGGDPNRRVEQLEAQLRTGGDRLIVRAELGHHLVRVGDFARAATVLEPLMRTPYRRDAAAVRAEALYWMGRYDDAKACLRDAVRLTRRRRDAGPGGRSEALRRLQRRLDVAMPIAAVLRDGGDLGASDARAAATVVYQMGDPARAEALFAAAFGPDGPVWPRTDATAEFTAACAAIAAGLDETRAVSDRRASLARARAWLDAGFTVVGARTKGYAEVVLRRRIVPWQHDVRLAPTRDAERLDALGADEVRAWRGFWRRYRNQLARTER